LREPYTQFYAHLIWATWDRQPLLQGEIRNAVYDCVLAECRNQKADVLAIGGVEDHVHLLIRYPPTVYIPQLLKHMKGVSSHLVTHKLRPGEFFKWQGHYMGYSVSRSATPVVRDYILRQEEHHKHGTCEPDYEPE
jgi:REP element-mobilizing transposase RayT